MAMNLDTTFKLKAKVEGARNVTQFKKQLRGLETSSKMSKAQLGKMNIEINRMARAAGNTTRGLKQHITALQNLRSRTEIGSKAYRRLGGEIDRLKGKLKGLDGQANKTGLKIANLVAGIGVGRAIRGTISGASRYDEQLRKAAAIEGKGANFGQIKSAVEETASVAAGTPTEVAELATTLSRAGFNAKEIQDALKGVVLGAEATGVSFAEMGSIASNNIRAFGLETEQTAALMDILVATANNSNQTVLDLGEALKYGAPVAKTFGLTVNDTAATLALLADNGIKASDAGTFLRTGLGRLQLAATGAEGKLLGVSKGSKLITKAMQELGAEVVDSSGKLKPMDDVIIAMKKSLDGFTNKGQKYELASAIFGKQQASKFLALVGTSDERLKSMFENIRRSAGETEATHAAMASFGREIKILGGNFNSLKNQVGAMIMAVLYPLAQALNAAYRVTLNFPTPIKRLGSALAAMGLVAIGVKTTFMALTAIGLKAVIFAKVAAAFLLLKKALLAAAGAMTVFNATNPVGWVAIAVTGLTTLTVLIPKFRDQIKELGATIKEWLFDKITALWNNLPPQLREFISGTGDTIQTITVPFVEAAGKGVNKIKEGIDNSNILGGGAGNNLEETGQKHNAVVKGMKEAWDEYKAKVNDTAGMVKDAFGNALQGLEEMFINFFNTGKLMWQNFTRTILLEIQKIVIRKAIIAPIMGGLETAFPFLANKNGNAFEANGIVPYRKGGIINSPTMFKYGGNNLGIAGEAGPESIMPLKRGSDGKLGVISHGAKGANVVVNVDATGSSVQGDDQNAAELGRILSASIEQKLIEAQQPGGLLYS